MRNNQDLIKHWTEVAESVLLNRKIVKVRYLLDEEVNSMGWYKRSLVMQLDDGTLVYPSMDDEGNDGGVLYYQKEGTKDYVLPVI